MIPVVVRHSERFIQFRSRKLFLRIIGKSAGYFTTNHFKERFDDVTFQELWEKHLPACRERLENLMKTNYVETDDNGVRSYKNKMLLVSPVGYGSDDTGYKSNGHAPVATGTSLTELLAARISEEIEKLIADCEAKEGKDAADLLRASIIEISVGVKSVSGNSDHWLVECFDSALFKYVYLAGVS